MLVCSIYSQISSIRRKLPSVSFSDEYSATEWRAEDYLAIDVYCGVEFKWTSARWCGSCPKPQVACSGGCLEAALCVGLCNYALISC